MLWSTASQPSRTKAPATRLTQSRKREAKGIPTATPAAPGANPLTPRQCLAPMVSRESSVAAPKLVRLDAHDPIANERRGDAQRRQAAARKAWNPSKKPDWLYERTYGERIFPHLAGIGARTIPSALAVSESYATNIRAGRSTPHPRHWLALSLLVGVSSAQYTRQP